MASEPSISLINQTKAELIAAIEELTRKNEELKAINHDHAIFRLTHLPKVLLLPDAPRFTISDVNRAFIEATGIKESDLIGKAIFDIYPNNSTEQYTKVVSNLRQSLLTVISTRKTDKLPVQKYAIAVSGTDELEERYWQAENIPVITQAANLEYIIHTTVDITERKKSEENILKEKEFSDSIINSLPGIFYMYDETGKFIRWNKNFEKVSGYNSQEVAQMHPLDFFDVDEKELLKHRIRNVFENGEADVEAHFFTKEGKKIPYYFNGRLIEFEGLRCLTGMGMDLSERIMANEAIRDSEEKRSLIMNAALDAIICIDTKGLITFWNPQAEKVFKWKEKEVMGRVLSEVIIPDPYRKMHDKGMENYLQTGKGPALNVLLELSAINREGMQFPIELTVLPIKQGNEEFFCAFIRDISQRKHTENMIRLSNERHSLIAKATNDSIWDWNLITNEVIRDGKRLEQSFGYEGWEPAEVDYYWNKYAHAEDWAEVSLKRNNILNDPLQNYWEDEYRFLRQNGEYAYVHDKGYIIRNSEGKAIRMIGASQDITERKIAEIILQNSELRFRSLIEKGSEIIAMHDAHGKILYMSPSIETVLGYKAEERIKMSPLASVHPDDLPEIKTILSDLMMKEGATARAQWRHRHADGSWRWMDGIATNLLHDPAVNAVVHNFRDITPQKEAEEKIKEERNLLRTLIDNMPDAIFVKDVQGRKLVSNPVDLAIMNMSSEAEVIGKTDLEIFPGERGAKGYENDMQVIRSGRPSMRQEREILLPSGKRMWILVSKMPLINEQGETLGLVGIGTDISHQKNIEAQLLLSNERFEYATKASFDAIWDWDLINNSLYWGEGFKKLFGYNVDNISADVYSWINHLHPDDIDRVTNGIKEVINSKETNWTDEYYYLKANGEYAYVIDKGIVIRDENGKGVRMIGAMHDITVKKKEEEQLKLLESVITHTTDSILITETDLIDSEGPRIVYVNDSFTAMTGYSREEVIGKTPRILQGPKTNRKELDRLKSAMKKHAPCKIEIINYKKNGEEFWVNISLVAVANEKGRYTHFIAVERDVTERRMAENELKQKNNELNRLTAYLQNVREEERKYMAREIHDELGQLATALKIDVDWLGIKVTGLDEAANKRIEHANKTIEVLISSVRKIASSLRPSVLDDFGLNSALKWHCTEFQNLNGIQCNFEPGFDDANLSMHTKTELFRIAQESLTNVMRHAKASSVLVFTREDENKQYLVITDNGKGFDSSQRKNTLGLIGLRERAVSINGKLEIESSTAQGTTIRVAIPKNQ